MDCHSPPTDVRVGISACASVCGQYGDSRSSLHCGEQRTPWVDVERVDEVLSECGLSTWAQRLKDPNASDPRELQTCPLVQVRAIMNN